MSRLIFFVLLGLGVVWLLSSYRRKQQGGDKPDVGEDFNAKDSTQGEDMVRCAQCGVHLPGQEAIFASGKYYCCDAHRREHTRKSA